MNHNRFLNSKKQGIIPYYTLCVQVQISPDARGETGHYLKMVCGLMWDNRCCRRS